MSRRLSVLASVILLLLAVVAVQAANIQFFKASALNASPINPRLTTATNSSPRGDIVAADGTILARSISQANTAFPYRRIYPLGSLTSGVVGFSGAAYGNWGLEAEYGSYLTAHVQPPKSFAQVLAPITAADSLNLTLYPSLQRVARTAMKGVLGAAVVLNPKNGDVLGMYSNPNYNPNPLTSTAYSTTLGFVVAKAEWKRITTPNQYGIAPLNLTAVQETFPPGSTFKVITASSFVTNQAGLAYSAIGQENVRATALQDALVAAAIGNHGVEMAPHLMTSIFGPDGQLVKRYTPNIWQQPLTPSQAAQIVPWMQNVVKYGTAAGVFSPADNVAAKTGTAQVGDKQQHTDDWMIAFAPANDPTVAVAVVMPYQATANYGATVAGPIVNCLVEDALAIQTHKPVHYTSSLCAG